MVVLDTETDGFRYFTLPNNDFPCDLQWVGNASFIGLSMTDSAWRLGAVYCANRESRIFQMDEHGHRYLSDPKRAAMCPRVSPSADYVIWQDREILGPHDSSRNILTSKIYPTSTDSRYVSRFDIFRCGTFLMCSQIISRTESVQKKSSDRVENHNTGFRLYTMVFRSSVLRRTATTFTF